MASYVVLEPNSNDLHGVDTVFVRDGLRWLAFLFPVFWLLWHRLWIEAALALALALGIGALATLVGVTGGTVLSLLAALFFGLEAPALYLAALRRRGWREVGLIEADSAADAETRYLAETTAQPGAPASRDARQPTQPIASSVPPGGRGQSAGLLFNPGRS